MSYEAIDGSGLNVNIFADDGVSTWKGTCDLIHRNGSFPSKWVQERISSLEGIGGKLYR